MMQTFKQIRQAPSWVWSALLLLLALALPFMPFMDRSRTSVAVFAGIYVMLGLSLNIIVGYAGLFQLGHAAFFGLGAYTAAILSIDHNISILATIPAAALVAGGAAILIAKPILHLRGDYLCIVTIAFGEIFRIAVTNNIFGITGGSNGLFGSGRPEFPLPWLEPVPAAVLVVVAALCIFLTRRDGPALQWGGAGLIAAGYYLPPLLLDQKPLYLVSIIMSVTAVGVLYVLRGRSLDARAQLIDVAVVVTIFVLVMLVGGETLAAEIDAGVQENFNVAEQPVEGALGLKVTPVAFKRDARPYYFLVLGFILLTIVGVRRLQDSRLGRAWLYVREDQLAAEAMGIDTTRVKLAAFAIGSMWAGVAGVLYASRFTVVAPESFNFMQSVIMFCIVVLGGSGSIPGVLVGTLGMVVLPELLRDAAPTFVYDGIGPVVILALILGSYLYISRRRLQRAALESGVIALVFFAPPLLLGQPPLYVIGIVMALAAVIALPLLRRRASNALPWLAGALAVYAVLMLLDGGDLGASLEQEISNFQIMEWRDGLMGVAMVVMMVLRPAGIIPERRKGVVISAVTEAPEASASVAAVSTT
jgi:ABC-type branched-subunit amino acid transport system permease subunit